jgi:hypothetical protein
MGIIRNIRTGYVSPQFHCVYDEWFTTVTSNQELTEDVPVWTSLFLKSRTSYFQDDDMDDHMPDLHHSWLDEHYREQRIRTRCSHQTYAPRAVNPHQTYAPRVVNPHQTYAPRVVNPFPNHILNDHPDQPEHDITNRGMRSMKTFKRTMTCHPLSLLINQILIQNQKMSRKSTLFNRPYRKKKGYYNPKFHGNEYINHASLPVGDSFLANMNHNSKLKGIESRTYQRLERLARDPITGTCDFLHPHAFAAKANDEDTPNLRQALNDSQQIQRKRMQRDLHVLDDNYRVPETRV